MALSQITRVVHRSSITGRFVSKEYALANPFITVTEEIKVLVYRGD